MGWTFFTKEGAQKRTDGLISVTNPIVRAYASAAQSTTTSVTLNLLWDSETFKTDAGMHSTSSNTGRLVATTAGKYLVTGVCAWATNGTGQRELIILKNGAQIAEADQNAASAFTSYQTVTTIIDLGIGDYVELAAWQNSGGGVNINGTANASSFSMAKLDSAVVSYVGVPGSMIGQELAYGENLSSIAPLGTGSYTDVITLPSYTFDGSTTVFVEFFCPLAESGASANSAISVRLSDSVSGVRGPLGFIGNGSSPGSTGGYSTLYLRSPHIVPTAGAHVFKVQAISSTSAGALISTNSGYEAMWARIVRA